jgi:membrane protein DedA with SNARE-associated domain
MNNLFTQITTIYLAGITGLYKGVPVGFALQSTPFLTALFTALGSVTVVLVIFFSGERFKEWLSKKFTKKSIQKKENLFKSIQNKYGLIGIGLIAPGIIGPIGASILGLMILKNTRLFLIYLIAGIMIWSTALTTVGYYSMDVFGRLF